MKLVIVCMLFAICIDSYAQSVNINPFGFCRYIVEINSNTEEAYFSHSVNKKCPQVGDSKYINVDDLPDGYISKIARFMDQILNNPEYNQKIFGELISSTDHSNNFFNQVSLQLLKNKNLRLKTIKLKNYSTDDIYFTYIEVTIAGKESSTFTLRLSDNENGFKIIGISEQKS